MDPHPLPRPRCAVLCPPAPLRSQQLLTEAERLVPEGDLLALQSLLRRILGEPNNLQQNLRDAAACEWRARSQRRAPGTAPGSGPLQERSGLWARQHASACFHGYAASDWAEPSAVQPGIPLRCAARYGAQPLVDAVQPLVVAHSLVPLWRRAAGLPNTRDAERAASVGREVYEYVLQIDYDQVRPSRGCCSHRLCDEACRRMHLRLQLSRRALLQDECKALTLCTLDTVHPGPGPGSARSEARATSCLLPPVSQYFETMAGARRDGRTQQQYYDFSLNSARAAQVGQGRRRGGARWKGLPPARAPAALRWCNVPVLHTEEGQPRDVDPTPNHTA